MAVFSSLISSLTGALGLGTTAAGAAGTAAGAATGLSGAIGAAGALAGVAGTVAQVSGQRKAAKEGQRQEALRQVQMQVEANRSRRDVIRRAMVARSEALSNATAQGASGGSGLAGGLAQISGQAGSNISAINNSEQLGSAIFASNRRLSAAQTASATGAGISSLGNALVQNQESLGRLGTYAIG